MNIVADESVDAPIVARLRQAGHEVAYVAELSPSLSDDAVLDLAGEREALLLTADKDFGELVFRLGRAPCGVVLVRLHGLSPKRKSDTVLTAIQAHGQKMLRAFSVIGPGALRVRGLDP